MLVNIRLTINLIYDLLFFNLELFSKPFDAQFEVYLKVFKYSYRNILLDTKI